jgi:hypothetical protein
MYVYVSYNLFSVFLFCALCSFVLLFLIFFWLVSPASELMFTLQDDFTFIFVFENNLIYKYLFSVAFNFRCVICLLICSFAGLDATSC